MLLPSCLPTALRMASPYLWDREQYRMWMDEVTVDVMKTNEALRLRFYAMYKIPALHKNL